MRMIKLKVGDTYRGQTSDAVIKNLSPRRKEFTSYAGWDEGDVNVSLPPWSGIELVSKGSPHCCAVLRVVPCPGLTSTAREKGYDCGCDQKVDTNGPDEYGQVKIYIKR